MFWLLLALLVVVAFVLALTRRRSYEAVDAEPWRASLEPDEPLDWEAAREAEEEWLAEAEREDEGEDESWRR